MAQLRTEYTLIDLQDMHEVLDVLAELDYKAELARKLAANKP